MILIVCARPCVTQVFEHVPEPFASARAMLGFLRPGGLLFWTAPFMERFHGVPGDYFRYTHAGAVALFEQAGFEVLAQYKMGDSLIATGYLMGFGVGDFDPAYLKAHLMSSTTWNQAKERIDFRENGYMEVALVLRRPLTPPPPPPAPTAAAPPAPTAAAPPAKATVGSRARRFFGFRRQ